MLSDAIHEFFNRYNISTDMLHYTLFLSVRRLKYKSRLSSVHGRKTHTISLWLFNKQISSLLNVVAIPSE